jgi:hypothetical protein
LPGILSNTTHWQFYKETVGNQFVAYALVRP